MRSDSSDIAGEILSALKLANQGLKLTGTNIPGVNSIFNIANLIRNPTPQGALGLIQSGIPDIARLMTQGLPSFSDIGSNISNFASGIGDLFSGLGTDLAGTIGSAAGSAASSLASLGPALGASMMSLFAGGGPLRFLDAPDVMTPVERARLLRGQAANKATMGIYDRINNADDFLAVMPQQHWGASLGNSMASMLNPRLGMYDMTESGQFSQPGNLSKSYIGRNNQSILDTMPDLALFDLMDTLHNMGYRGSNISPEGVGTLAELDWDPMLPSGQPLIFPNLPASAQSEGRGGVQEMMRVGSRIGPGAHPQTEAPRSVNYGGKDIASQLFGPAYQEPSGASGVPVTGGYQAWEPTQRNLAGIVAGQMIGARSPYGALDQMGYYQPESGEGQSGQTFGAQTMPWEAAPTGISGPGTGKGFSSRAASVLGRYTDPNSPLYMQQGTNWQNWGEDTGQDWSGLAPVKMKPLYYDGPERDVPANVLMKSTYNGGMDPLYLYELQEKRPQSYSSWTNADQLLYPWQYRTQGPAPGEGTG
jgi:hypothetical protein